MARTLKIAVVLACMATGLLAGCPGSTDESAPVDTCADARVGQQCKLGGGQLGVCMMDTAGQSFCQDQH